MIIQKIVKELEKRIMASETGEIELTMKYNNDKVYITACCQGKMTNISDAEYFLVDSPSIPYLGGDTLEIVAKQLINYGENIERNNEEKQRCKKFFEEKIAKGQASDEELTMYSDWHKDLFGYRPRGITFNCKNYK